MGDAHESVSKRPGDARRFAAFISYSHADADAAAKLQRKLERYRLPKRIADSRVANGAGLGRIFRDREDFAAAVSLSAAIREAISQAEAMVVICSPEAAASPWVQAEIELFRQLHPDRLVLAALLSGEPAVSFPAALTRDGVEPLAADLRRGGDGEQLGFLKIVAGIAGVPLDELIQRDAQRRLRRVTAITATALAAMLVMGIMTSLALQARNEAARQRAAAEGLVEYMLTDLRQKLKGVGRLDVMESVNRQAMKHYQRQGDLTRLPANSLARRARILHAMGEDDEKQGDLKLALAKFQEAHRTTAAALKQNENNPRTIIAHAQSEYWVGYAKQKTDDRQGAISAYNNYLRLAELGVANGLPADEGEREKGWAHNALGVVYYEQLKDYNQAISHFQQYRAIFEKLWQKQPQNLEILYSLADSHAWLAQVASEQGKLEIAVSERRAQIELLRRLFAIDPKTDQPLWALIGAEREIFRICFRRKEYTCATSAIARAKQLLQSRNFDQANRDWLWQSAYVSLDVGFLAEKIGSRKSAFGALVAARNFGQRYRDASEGDHKRVVELDGTIDALASRLQ